LDKLPSQLSGGMQKRIGIARAVIHKPRYLFYDEPTTGLDPASSYAIDELMEEMANEPGRTSVIVTHDLATVRRIASRVIMLHKGLVRFDGAPEAFFESNDEVVQSFLKRT
jgi:phospholipid/cholesterol/gamma-HCH transport system ATP-binding protein